MAKVVCGVPKKTMRLSSLGVSTLSPSVTSWSSFSLIMSVAELEGTSTSSKRITSARLPVICPVMPTLLTEGLCAGLQPYTSNDTRLHRWSSSFGVRCCSHGISMRHFWQKMVKSSARCLEADTTMIFLSLSRYRIQRAKAAAIQLLPRPRNAEICSRLGPFWRYVAMAIWALVGRGRSSDFQTRARNKGKEALRRSSEVA